MAENNPTIPPPTSFSEDERMLLKAAGELGRTAIKPKWRAREEAAELDAEVIKTTFAMGRMGSEIPERYGGSGGTFFMSILAIEQISRADASVAVFMDVQNTLVNNVFLRWGTEALNEKYLPLLASEKVGAYCLSESGSGSDAFALKC